VHERLCRVPNNIADRLLGVDAQQMLQDAEERYLLRRVGDLAQDGVEDVEVGADVDAARALQQLRLVAFTLLVEHVELHAEVGLRAGTRSCAATSAHKGWWCKSGGFWLDTWDGDVVGFGNVSAK
jgi:hypothetical protein